MSRKRLTVAAIALVLLVAVGAVVSAHDSPFGLTYSDLIQEATGLDVAAIASARQDGSSLAQLIEANDGDFDAVIASLVAEARAQIIEAKDARIAALPELVGEALDRSWQWNVFGRKPVILGMFGKSAIIKEATGLDAAALRDALLEGSSLAEMIEDNGGDVDTITTELDANARAKIEEIASTRIDALEEIITDQLNDDLVDRWRRRRRFGRRSWLVTKTS